MPTLKVLDISHHNTITSFEKIRAAGVVGIIHKSSQGLAMTDGLYAKRRQAALNAGLLWGAYHFATGDDVDLQVKHFLDSAEPDENTLMALDHEPNNGNQLDLDGAQAFLESARDQLGRKLVLYSGNLIKEQLGSDDNEFFGSHRLWLAQYSPVPRPQASWDKAWLWQYSESGSVNGAGGKLDLNSYAASDEQLTAEWAGG